ncbi:hypothetical protein HO133_004062 [Letharia lupina]|uniref:Zn(2)-C6 fungal-type domain-containing protein n=1 Tax=Letharia lupina TaxID=560253 RepID=A0A8H6CA79_9LECA|nr:uncharacterized protein HO133_004062 [Letharia lupina]KAF6219593.1 hypothetical protein HO133_004062 [Letharia lupina]
MSSDPNKPGQYPPPQWDSQPQRGAYPVPPHYRGPPQPGYGSSPSTPGEMVTLPPPPQGHPDMRYAMPPHDMYSPYGPPDPRAMGQPHMGYQSQPAPRQRTAIACRYCRRRKIRCSGFEASDDGRCTNCQRFQQECIFTPVSSQAQAFVPAHTAYPHLRNTGALQPQRGGRPLYPQQGQPAIYGAHGQPLGPMTHDPNYPPPHGYPMPPPGPYQGGPVYDDRGHPQPPHAQDKGPNPYYPPPQQQQPPPPQQQQQPPPARRTSPQSAYSYDARASGSPHGSTSSASAYNYPGGLHPPQVLPPREGRTPPPAQGQTREGNGNGNGNGSAQRGGMAVRDLLGPGQAQDNSGGRSSADSDMLRALNKKGPS